MEHFWRKCQITRTKTEIGEGSPKRERETPIKVQQMEPKITVKIAIHRKSENLSSIYMTQYKGSNQRVMEKL